MKIEGTLESIDERVLKIEGEDPVQHRINDVLLPILSPGMYVEYQEDGREYFISWKTPDGSIKGYVRTK